MPYKPVSFKAYFSNKISKIVLDKVSGLPYNGFQDKPEQKEHHMIKNSKQKWEVGQEVKVGFMTLTVTAKEPTPGDWLPDAYLLVAKNGNQYRFVPHNGLERI
jgi:hypothetical protein